MREFFLKIYQYFERKPAIMWVCLLFLVVLCGLSALRLNFVEDIGRFLPSNKDNEQVNYAYEHLGGDNKLVINIAMANGQQEPDYDLLTEAADQVAEQLAEQDTTGLIKNILYQIDETQISEVMNFVIENMPLFLTEEDYARMDTMLEPAHIARQLGNDRDLLSSPMAMMRPMIQRDPLFFSANILQSLNAFKLDDTYQTESDHIFSKDGKEAIVVVNSSHPLSETKCNGQLIQLIDRTLQQVEQEHDGALRITCFGASQVSLTNSSQIKKDSFLAIALSMVLIIALLLYYYRNIRSIMLIVACITFGGLFALGAIALFKNPVSVIAIGVASIIIGIAINYPIHVLSHFKRTDDKETIIREVVTPLLIGNITTVGAFLSLLFISSDAMKDLGLFAALLLVGTILFVLIFLPHMMGKHYQSTHRELAFRAVAEFRPENIRGLFWIIVVLTIVFNIFSARTSFDTNMHHINYMTKEQQAAFEQLRAASDTNLRTLYCIAEGKSMDEALANFERTRATLRRFEANEHVRKISGIGPYLPSQATQAERIQRWNRFWENKRERFFSDLDKAALQNGFTPEAFQLCKTIIEQEYTPQGIDYFDIIRENLAANYISEEANKTLVYSILQVDKNHIEGIEQQLDRIGNGVYAFTDSSIASRLVDALSNDFNYVLYICGIIVFFFLMFSFGRIEISLMAFLPLFVAWIWILGIMGLTGIQFNIVNIILATFIFGMGDDYSIFVTEGLIYEYAYGRKMLSQFKNSIILSASIMFIGIGMLIFAKHPAMRSLAEVIIIGMISVVLMAYTIPPIVFKWLIYSRNGQPRKQPITLRRVFISIIGFPYFFFGVCILSVYGFFILRLGGRTDEHKFKYHKLLKTLMLSTAKIIPHSRFHIDNPHNEDFEKPAIIICNHQSHFDLLYTLSLTPKVIAMTNDWAWNMPLYRRILRNGDYLPASYGMDSNFTKVQEMVDKGYSILIFPEGTRSVEQNILRFHKGAFYLADKLGLDILPIILHGVGDMFPKHDPFIHKGDITISIGERIAPDNEQFRKGKEHLETARLFRHYYIDNYRAIKKQAETPAYLYDIVYHNYIYKGKDVERICKKKLTLRYDLEMALANIPEHGTMLYKNCGNGELSMMAAMLRRGVRITAYDADADSIAIASHCTAVPENLTYTHELPDESTFDWILDETTLSTPIP